MRKHYIDNIRTGTILLVVLYHVIYLFNGCITYGVIGPFHESQWQDALQYVLYPWFMVILFLVSGVSAQAYLQHHTPREFIRSRTDKLLMPSTLGLLVYGWIQGYFSMTFSHAFSTMPDTIPAPVMYLIMTLSGTSILWFIQMLWLYSLLLIFLLKIEKGRFHKLCQKATAPVLLLSGFVLWLFAQIGNPHMISVYRFGIYGFAFFAGYFLFSEEEVIERLQAWSIPLILAALILAVVYVNVYFGQNYATDPVVNSPLSMAYCWITCLAVFAGMRRWGNRTSLFIDYLRQNSWGIYIFHYLVLSITGYVLVTYTSLLPIYIYMITLTAALTGSVLLYHIISQIPVIRYLVLGIRKRKE